MDPMNNDPTLRPLPPRVRIFQSLLVLAVFALVPLWPAQAQALRGQPNTLRQKACANAEVASCGNTRRAIVRPSFR
jgi:hypothetical protein